MCSQKARVTLSKVAQSVSPSPVGTRAPWPAVRAAGRRAAGTPSPPSPGPGPGPGPGGQCHSLVTLWSWCPRSQRHQWLLHWNNFPDVISVSVTSHLTWLACSGGGNVIVLLPALCRCRSLLLVLPAAAPHPGILGPGWG